MLALAVLLASTQIQPTLCVDSLIMGTWHAGHWTVASDKLPTWKHVTFTQVRIGEMGSRINVSNAVMSEMSAVPFLNLEGAAGNGALWSGPTPGFPRKVSRSKVPTAADQATVKDILKAHKHTGTPIIWGKIITGDFDGDGRQDRIIEARNTTAQHGAGKKDWSMVVYLQAGHKPFLLSWDEPVEEYLCMSSPVAVADFDHDGILDIALSRSYIEGLGGELWSLRKKGPVKVLEKGA